MNENINLCELLKGHEGETFYSPICGDIIFCEINFNLENPIRTNRFNLSQEGKWNKEGEIMIFPSKDQRDWNKWAEEQKPKVPKTWDELTDYLYIIPYISRYNKESGEVTNLWEEEMSLIEKSALALLKIHQLIEVGYGGNITNDEWENISTEKCVIEHYTDPHDDDPFFIEYYSDLFHHIAFHTKEQVKEFLSHEENVQLLKDFYMI